MSKYALFLIPAALFAQSASASPPPGIDQSALVARMRDAAVNYADRLQDFLCTEFTTRTADTSGTGKHWKLLESQELELGYVAHAERSRLLKVNGKDRAPEKSINKGYWHSSGGEFGSALLGILLLK